MPWHWFSRPGLAQCSADAQPLLRRSIWARFGCEHNWCRISWDLPWWWVASLMSCSLLTRLGGGLTWIGDFWQGHFSVGMKMWKDVMWWHGKGWIGILSLETDRRPCTLNGFCWHQTIERAGLMTFGWCVLLCLNSTWDDDPKGRD